MRVLAALLAGIVGAIAGAGALGMGLAYILTAIYGDFEGSAAMGGFFLGMPVGGIIGVVLGPWLILRKGGPSTPGKALAWVAGSIVLLTAYGAWVWEYA
ncbi:MAG: hypothetical protein ACHQK9_05245 [Reyranellales bacterium]